MQLDANYLLNANNQFFVRFWLVYEPPYPWEARNIAGPNLVYDKSQSEIYNRYDVRDAYWKSTDGPLTWFAGRQIVTWGESIAFRVGDVVNPQDLSWNFGFANLEQSRMPLWMLHPILSIPSVGPFNANFVEGIWAPAWQPLYDGRQLRRSKIPRARQRGRLGQLAGAERRPLRSLSVSVFDTPRRPQPASRRPFRRYIHFVSPFQTYRLPSDTWANSAEGVRLHTLVEDAEITALYWHAHQLNPTNFVIGQAPGGTKSAVPVSRIQRSRRYAQPADLSRRRDVVFGASGIAQRGRLAGPHTVQYHQSGTPFRRELFEHAQYVGSA